MLEWLQTKLGLDFESFCLDTIDKEPVKGCLGSIAGNNAETYLDLMIRAWGWTLAVAALSLAVAMIIGSIIGVMRTLPNRPLWVRFGNAWVELFRNIPLLVQIFLWYFVVPALVPFVDTFIKNHGKLGSLIMVVCALGFFTSARIAEQVRSGIEALPKGQRYAGMALGMTTWQYYRYVLLPMAYRIIIPPLTSESMNIFKNSSVAVAVGITELIWFAQQGAEETSRPTEMYLGATVLYIVSALAINRIMVFIERKSRVPGFVANTSGGGH